MRILQLISSGGYYGAESMIVNLAESLEKLGHHCTLGLFDNVHRPKNDFAEVAETQGITVERIVSKGRMDWNAVRAIRECVNRRRIDVIHSHGYKADAYALAAVGRNRQPLVSTCHNWLMTSVPLRVYRFLDLFCLRSFDACVAVSADVAAILRSFRIPEARITTIANGVNLSRFRSAHPAYLERSEATKGLIVGMVGRLTPEKGQEFLLRAAPGILEQFPQTLFVFVGDGPSRQDLEELVQDLDIAPNVRFLGQRRDMPELYAAMDVFVLPSLREAMPMVVLEAMAAGKLVIATRIGDIPKLVVHEKTGVLVKPQDIAGLRDAILRLITQPEVRAHLAANGSALVDRNFSAEVMARQYEGVYERIRAERRARPKPEIAANCQYTG